MSRPQRKTFDVFVGNLPNYVDRNYVDNLFRTCGEISSISVLYSKYNRSKVAYVRFHCEQDALKAVEKFKTLTLNGNPLEVKLMPPRVQNNKNASPSSNSDGNLCGNGDGANSTDFGMTSTVFNKKPDEVTLVCHIENPVTFYGQSIPNLLEIQRIGEKLQSHCLTFSSVPSFPHVNQIYAARFSQDQAWYRCRVTHVDVSKSYVCYIDYGNTEYVNHKDLVLLPDDLVKIPPQSSMFVFKDLKPVLHDENKELYDKAMNYMKKMINEKVQLDTVFSTESFHYINRCMFQGKDIYYEVQRKGFAKKVASSNEKHSPSEKHKLNVPGNNEKNGSSQASPKGKSQQNLSNKANAYKKSAPSFTTNNTIKGGFTASKRPPAKHSGKEFSVELETLRSENARLSKELALEKETSKALLKENEALKIKIDENCFEKLDSVILKTQELMLMRNQQSSEGADGLEEIYDVVQAKLLDQTQMLDENSDLHAKVEKAILEYKNSLEELGQQEQESELLVLVSKRDEACKVACDLMKEYLESWNGDHLTERVVYLKKLLLELKQKYEKNLEASVGSDDRSLEELISEYKETKLKSKSSMEAAQKDTNDALSQLSSIIDNLKKDITVPDGKENDENPGCISFSSANFADCFKEVQKAVEAEMAMRDKAPGSAENGTMIVALVRILIKEIETPLEAALQQINDCKQYNLLYPELCSNLATKPDMSRIYETRKEIKILKSKLRHKLADKKDLEESDEMNTSDLTEINASLDAFLHELHTCFQVENDEMMKLGNAYKSHFRELNVSNPDLNLSHYLKCDSLVKEHWEIEHFNCSSMAKRPGICYSAKFCDESVVIKEYHMNSDEYDQFLNKVLPWHAVKEENVVPVHAVFRSKTGFQTYAVFPYFPSLEESETEYPFSQSHACQVLRDVLKGLACIHSQGLVHSQLNPSTILIKSNTSLLDFSFTPSHVNSLWESKGIIFCPPEKEISQASDMYNFGCLILWMLFPNLQFASTMGGVVDIAGYKSIVQDVLSSSSYEDVASLLSADTSVRLSAKSLLEKCIFDELINSSSKDDPSPTSTPVSRTSEEISMLVSATSEECSEPTSSDAGSSSDR